MVVANRENLFANAEVGLIAVDAGFGGTITAIIGPLVTTCADKVDIVFVGLLATTDANQVEDGHVVIAGSCAVLGCTAGGVAPMAGRARKDVGWMGGADGV